MQRMRQQKLSCILASVKVSLFLSCSLFFFLLCFHVSLTSLYAFECWAVGVGPTHVQWLPINPNTQCEIIKCVFTCRAWLGRRDTNTDRTATHCKYLSPSAGRARINNKQVAAKFFTETVAHVSVKCLVRRWLNIHMHTACYSSAFTEHCRNTHTQSRVRLLAEPCCLWSVCNGRICPSSFHCLLCSMSCFLLSATVWVWLQRLAPVCQSH